MSVKSQHKITHQQADGAVYLPFEKVFTAKFGGTLSFPIDKGTMILGMVVRCTTTVASTGTAAVTVGDSSAADTWVGAAATLETAGNILSTLVDKAAKYYSAADRLIVAFDADCTAGEIELRVLFSGMEG